MERFNQSMDILTERKINNNSPYSYVKKNSPQKFTFQEYYAQNANNQNLMKNSLKVNLNEFKCIKRFKEKLSPVQSFSNSMIIHDFKTKTKNVSLVKQIKSKSMSPIDNNGTEEVIEQDGSEEREEQDGSEEDLMLWFINENQDLNLTPL